MKWLRALWSSPAKWLWILIGWTVFLWLSRLRNVLNNDELTTSGRAVRVGVVIIFIALAGLAVVGLRKRRPAFIGLFMAWTAGYWLVRGIGILIDGDYSIGFKTVHTVLMLVSLALVGLAAAQFRPVGSRA